MTRFATLVSAVIAMTIADAPAHAASQYRWKYRPVFVFAGSGDNAAVAEQRRIFAADRAGLTERDIVVVWVTSNSVHTDLGPAPGETPAQLRARFGADAKDFRVFLVGKDGSTKLSQKKPISLATLFGTIDAMPMRHDEIHRRREKS